MDRTELRGLLNEGIQAAKANDRARARDRLLRVLESDDQNEPAWLWLSATLDDPADQLMALERVLAINPRHPQALAGAQALRQRLGPAETTSEPAAQPVEQRNVVAQADKAVAPETTPQAPAQPAVVVAPEPSAAVYDMFSSEDDPYQCAYCGKQTHPDDERCRYCGRSLLIPGPWRGGGYLYLALLLTGIQLQSALVQALASYLISSYPQASRILPLLSLWSGSQPFPAILRATAWAVVVVLLLGDYDSGYGVAAIIAVLDLSWSGIGYRLGFLPAAQAGVNTALAVIIFLIGLMAVISQAQSRRRLQVIPDRGLQGALMFHRRAVRYARQGKWALAALHWRRAISRSPDEALYYKALGRADARLGRYAEAVRAFKSGAEAAPHDREFTRLIEKVRAHARSS